MGRRDIEKRRRGDAIRQAGRSRRSEAIRNAAQIKSIRAASAAEDTPDKGTTGPEVASSGGNGAPADQTTSVPADGAFPWATAFLVQVRTADGREGQGHVVTYIAATETPSQAISAVRAATADTGGEVIDFTFPVGRQTVIGLGLAKGQLMLIKGPDSPSVGSKDERSRGQASTSATRNDA